MKLFILLFFIGCATAESPPFGTSPIPVPTPSPSPIATTAPGGRAQVIKGWLPDYDYYIANAIKDRYPRLLAIEDWRIKDYCPAYVNMNMAERAKFFTDFMYALAKPESGHNRTLIYVESTMSKDPMTGYQVRSEGLFQLSYQDKNSYGSACDFNWPEDKAKAVKDYDAKVKAGDGTRNIHDAYRNIECTLSIFDQQLFKHAKSSRFQDALDNYWFVMRRTSERSREAYGQVRAALRERTNKCSSPNYY